LKDIIVEIVRKASDKGTLFDGIEKKDIAKALTEKVNHRIEAEMIRLEEPIKHTGKHTVGLELAPDVASQIVVEVKAE